MLLIRNDGLDGAGGTGLLTSSAVQTGFQMDFFYPVNCRLFQKPGPETEGTDGVAERPENRKARQYENRDQKKSEHGQFVGGEQLEQIEMVIKDGARPTLVNIKDPEEQQDEKQIDSDTDGDRSGKGELMLFLECLENGNVVQALLQRTQWTTPGAEHPGSENRQEAEDGETGDHQNQRISGNPFN